MIHVYSINSLKVRKHRDLSQLLLELPSEMHGKAHRYRFKKDAFNYVLGRLLLKNGLKNLNAADSIESITYAENGKPLLPETHFNISHSGDLVVCAIQNDYEIGIDIEVHKSINLPHFSNYFTQKEWHSINSSENPDKKFFWYWTRKESIIKALGKNLAFLHEIELDTTKEHFIYQDEKWFLSDFNIQDGSSGCICSKSSIKWVHQQIEI